MTAVSPADRPSLHPCVEFVQDPRSGAVLVLDRLQRHRPRLQMGAFEAQILRLFDGRLSLRDVQLRTMTRLGGRMVPIDDFVRLARLADEAGLLDGPRFQKLREDPIREPSCLDAYPDDRDALSEYLNGLFEPPRGPGRPRPPAPDGRLRAALIPHIDYGRGGVTYAWGFKDVFERTDARLFVIVATSHFSGHRFTLTRKHFRTPLGVVETDQGFIDRLVRHYGDGLFDDELGAHLPEHSVELEVVFLQHLYAGREPIRIVPLVIGSFSDCVETGRSPAACDDVARMVQALRQAEAETNEPICWIISGDLAHIGPFFRDPEPLGRRHLEHSRNQDHTILKQAESANPESYFRVIADERDSRRICGLPPTYLVLEALRPGRGKLLHYDQYVDGQGFQSVSFASVSFYR